MVHTYKISGMTCSGCEATVKSNLLKLPNIESVEVSKDTDIATIGMGKHVSLADLQNALGANSKYIISEDISVPQMKEASWLVTYKPLFVLFLMIFIVSLLTSEKGGMIQPRLWMRYFMAGFFLSFSFFKLINVKGFADSYSMYDVVAKRIKLWGHLYPFAELGLGIAYVTDFSPLYTNIATVAIMGISSIGVIESVASKKKIQCACLGAVFNLPMSTITILEDLLMVVMAALMIWIK